MSEIKKYQNWPGLEEYTKEFKEWIWKLFRKVHARIGHVEEELAHVREEALVDYELLDKGLQPDGTYLYELYEENSGTPHGSISINTSGEIQVVKWYDAKGQSQEIPGNALTKVIRWSGSLSEWQNKTNSNDWENCIVFGKVTDQQGRISYRYFAGKDEDHNKWEFKNSVISKSLQDAESYLIEGNAGLIINVVGATSADENGAYIVTYNSDGSLQLLKMGNDIYWAEDEIEPIN